MMWCNLWVESRLYHRSLSMWKGRHECRTYIPLHNGVSDIVQYVKVLCGVIVCSWFLVSSTSNVPHCLSVCSVSLACVAFSRITQSTHPSPSSLLLCYSEGSNIFFVIIEHSSGGRFMCLGPSRSPGVGCAYLPSMFNSFPWAAGLVCFVWFACGFRFIFLMMML